jgi:Tol biopolymer transport system component
VFIVDVPEDLTVPGPLGPLEGTATDYPKPPKGAVVRRLTRTAATPDAALRGVTGHLRASGDGRWIAFVGKVRRAGEREAQVFVVSPTTGEIRQLSDLEGGVAGDPRFSPDSRYVVAAATDGRVVQFSAERETWGHATSLTAPNANLPRNLVISPDSRIIAYNRAIEGVLQVFRVDAAR